MSKGDPSKRVINIGEVDFIQVENKPKAGCPDYPLLNRLIAWYKAALGLDIKKSSAGNSANGIKGPSPPEPAQKQRCPSYTELLRKMIALHDRLGHHGKGKGTSKTKGKGRPLEPAPPKTKPEPVIPRKKGPIYKVPDPRPPAIKVPKPRPPGRDQKNDKGDYR